MKEMNGKSKFVYLDTCGCVFSEQGLKRVPAGVCVKVRIETIYSKIRYYQQDLLHDRISVSKSTAFPTSVQNHTNQRTYDKSILAKKSRKSSKQNLPRKEQKLKKGRKRRKERNRKGNSKKQMERIRLF